MNRERRLEIKDEPAGGEGGRGREGGREGRRGEGGREREKNESVNCKVHVEQNKRRQKGERY